MNTDKAISSKEGNRLIAEAGNWKLATNFTPDIWERGGEKLTSISFHKARLFGKLMEIVDKLEQGNNLYIIIKRKECLIQKMNLASHQTIIHKEANTKQQAVWEAVVEYLDQQTTTPNL